MFIQLKRIVEESDTTAGKSVDLFIQALIVASLISFSIETLPGISENTRKLLGIAEVVTIIIFTIEYLLRILVADKKLKFIFSFYGLIDLIAIAPFYLALGADLRSVRVFRLFRLLRLFKMLRYSKALKRYRDAVHLVKEELILFTVATALLLFVAAVGIYHFENPAQPDRFKSVFHSLWWAIITLTTVGYGDFYPITVGGKIFTSFVVIIGVGVIAIPTGLFASALTRTIKEDRE